MPFKSGNVAQGVGTVYVAPLGTSEPVSVTGAWPTGWLELGYTAQGSTFTDEIKIAGIQAEEEIYDLRQVTTGKTSTFAASMLEYNEQNLLLAMNAGIGSGVLPGTVTALGDGSGDVINPPTPGFEVRVMLGWDFLPKGSATPPTGQVTFGRLIIRQALQGMKYSLEHRKGNKATTIESTWTAEVPATGSAIYSLLVPAAQRTP